MKNKELKKNLNNLENAKKEIIKAIREKLSEAEVLMSQINTVSCVSLTDKTTKKEYFNTDYMSPCLYIHWCEFECAPVFIVQNHGYVVERDLEKKENKS